MSNKNFNASAIKDRIATWIRVWFLENGRGCNAVIGLSGGKDSSVVAALCVEALGKDRVIGVTMPNILQSSDEVLTEDGLAVKTLVDYLGVKCFNIPINAAYAATIEAIQTGTNAKRKISNQTFVNLAPRLRMATLYAVAQTYNGRVANTCNLSEDWVGYSTRYGDSVGDFSPLSKLTVTEVKEIGKVLGLPIELVEKKPADGLCGKTDEENLGFTYAELDEYIRTGRIDDKEKKQVIDNLHEKNLFKLQLMPVFTPNIE